MTPPLAAPNPRAARVRELFERALETSGHDREALVERARREDLQVGSELEDLLEAHDSLEDRWTSLDTGRAAALLELDAPDPGESGYIGRFEVMRPIGRGGMGLVYLGFDPELQREVALKVLAPSVAGPEEAADRLLNEARAASRLDHPGIATIYDVGRTEDGRLFMAMAYYPGATLAERIAEGPLHGDEAVSIARGVAEALSAAHEAGLVHRDIKPANIMLVDDGTVRVLDFGIARLLEASPSRGEEPAVGTVAYMSPEQTRGEVVDGRSDQWSLGVTLWEMLTGSLPFEAERLADMLARIRGDSTSGEPDPDFDLIPPKLRPVLRRCLSRDPDERFADARELAEALRALETRRGELARWGRLATAATLVIATGAAWFVGSQEGSPVHPAAAALAVLPLSPAAPDSSLERIGRELAVTLAMNLDGVGEIRVVDPVAVLARPELRAGLATSDRVEAALGLGASGVVEGTLVRVGEQIRVDLSMVPLDGGEPLARATAAGSPDELLAITDSLTLELLRGVWRSGTPPTPSLAGLTTGSIPSLRAFLEGEQAVAEGRLREAPVAFQRAIEADSTFWLAYWRLWWTRGWYSEPVADDVRRTVLDHLADLPPRDSALAALRVVASVRDAIEGHRGVVRDYPNDWLAWFSYQDVLVHSGGYFGRTLEESREALEEVVRLKPDLVRGWDHLFWVAREQRDTLRMQQAIARLTDLRYDSISLSEGGFDDLQYIRVQAAIVSDGGELSAEGLALGMLVMMGSHGTAPPLRIVSNLFSEGFSGAQLQLSEAIVAAEPPLAMQGAAWYASALSWAARGRWAEAMEASGRFDDVSPSAVSALSGLRLAGMGAVLGALDEDLVEVWVDRLHTRPESDQPEIRAEEAWLRGVLAGTRGDTDEVTRWRSEITRLSDPHAELLGRSLTAFVLAHAGDSLAAADSLSAIAAESAARGLYRVQQAHPLFDGLVRLEAARLYLDLGAEAEAHRLLTFTETILPDTGSWLTVRANRVLEPLVHLERVRVESALGREDRAEWHLDRALEHLDQPDPAVAERVRRARSLLAEPGG